MANNILHIQDQLTRPGGLATLLRAARGVMLSKDLAARTGWQISKISKIEHGKQLPDAEDLDVWAEHTGAGAVELHRWAVLLDEANAALKDYATQTRAGQRALQRRFNDIIAEARVIRIYEQTFIPRFLQLPGYSRAVLQESLLRHGGANDIDQAVAERQLSLPALDDPEKTIELLITEPVLGWRFATLPRGTHLTQLHHLREQIGVRSNVRIGIIPLFQPIGWLPQNGFQLFDNLGFAETWTADLEYILTQDIERLTRVMDELWHSAREGDQARAIIDAAIARLEAAEN
jgi:transcriptional regulator with XRE-family HTH domain